MSRFQLAMAVVCVTTAFTATTQAQQPAPPRQQNETQAAADQADLRQNTLLRSMRSMESFIPY